MPVQAPSWTEFLICPICTNEFAANLRAPVTLRCGHSICKKCLANIQQCPYDQVSKNVNLNSVLIIVAFEKKENMFRIALSLFSIRKKAHLIHSNTSIVIHNSNNKSRKAKPLVFTRSWFILFIVFFFIFPVLQSTISKDLETLPINYALLQLVTSSSPDFIAEQQEILPSIVQSLTAEELDYYKLAKGCIEELALYLKPNGSISGLFSRPMQRKLVTLINCQLIEEEGRARAMRAARSLGERTVTELILQHQNPQQLSANLWAAVRARGCQFLGPAMQEEVLKLVLLALADGVSLCRKVLVMYVVQKLEESFPQASKTSIGHVVQLLYRASCFHVTKREANSSLMQLKEEFRTYKSLRKEHDSQIVQIATEAGLRIAPDQWSALLYGDPDHKSDMQSLIDKQQSPLSFGQSVQELMIALQRTSDPANLSALRGHLKNLSEIDASPDSSAVPMWKDCAEAIESVKHVVNGLVDFVQHHGSRKSQDAGHLSHTTRYKISFCRDLSTRGNCPRGQNCTFAHNDEELERYRAKMKKQSIRPHAKGPSNYSVNIGPNPKVNISHPQSYTVSQEGPSRYNKSMPYRSENSLHLTPAKSSQHLMPTYPTGASSNSTPNLSQTQLSPKLMSAQQSQMPNRFSYNGNSYMNSTQQDTGTKINYQNYRPPPLSAPPVPQPYSPDYKKQYSPYNQMSMNQSPSGMMKNSGYFQMPQRPDLRNDDYSNNNNNGASYAMTWRSGNDNADKMKSSGNNHLMPNSPISESDSSHTSPTNRHLNDWQQSQSHIDSLRNYVMIRKTRPPIDEIDSMGMENMFISGKQPPATFRFDTGHSSKDFIRSDSILTSNNDDDYTFDNMSMSSAGKYGPIGIKANPSNDRAKFRDPQVWSGLQPIQKRDNMPYAGGPSGGDMRMPMIGSMSARGTSNGNNNLNRPTFPQENYMNSPIPGFSVRKKLNLNLFNLVIFIPIGFGSTVDVTAQSFGQSQQHLVRISSQLWFKLIH